MSADHGQIRVFFQKMVAGRDDLRMGGNSLFCVEVPLGVAGVIAVVSVVRVQWTPGFEGFRQVGDERFATQPQMIVDGVENRVVRLRKDSSGFFTSIPISFQILVMTAPASKDRSSHFLT